MHESQRFVTYVALLDISYRNQDLVNKTRTLATRIEIKTWLTKLVLLQLKWRTGIQGFNKYSCHVYA